MTISHFELEVAWEMIYCANREVLPEQHKAGAGIRLW